MDLTKAVLPDSIMVSGKAYKIHTGHPWWFRFAEILDQEVKYLADFDYLYIDEIPEDRQAGIDALSDFFMEKKEIPRSDGEGGPRIADYKIDADYIYAGVLQCYGIDLMEKEYHWHKVRAMIIGLTGTRFNDIMSFRSAKPGDKVYDKLRRTWALPEKVSESDREARARFDAQFE